MKIIVLGLFIIQMLFISCTSYYQTKLTTLKNKQTEVKEESTQKNKELTANIGEQVYSYNKYTNLILQLYKNEIPIIFPKPYFDTWDGVSFDSKTNIKIEKDSLINFINFDQSIDNVNEIWVTNYSYNWTFANQNSTSSTYFVIENDSINRISYTMLSRNYKFNPKIPLKKIDKIIKGSNFFSFELIYLGIQNNSIVLSYREYTEDMLRSNFSQSVYYNLNEIKDNVIQYKNIKIKIIDYNNQNIKYMVID